VEIAEIQRLAQQYGLAPSKSKGQNFLINEKRIDEIIAASGVQRGERVVEIGPGFGVLTHGLVAAGAKVTVVELDQQALVFLRKEYGNTIKIIEGDILRTPTAELANGEPYRVIANIPYNITAKILRKFTEEAPLPTSMTLMVQKEVAQRLSAKPGDMSIIAVSVQFYADVSYITTVNREEFWPAPEVDSAILHLKLHDRNVAALGVPVRDFFRVVKFGFAARRKMLSNTLAAGLHLKPAEVLPLLEAIGANPKARAQELSMAQWMQLTQHIYGSKK